MLCLAKLRCYAHTLIEKKSWKWISDIFSLFDWRQVKSFINTGKGFWCWAAKREVANVDQFLFYTLVVSAGYSILGWSQFVVCFLGLLREYTQFWGWTLYTCSFSYKCVSMMNWKARELWGPICIICGCQGTDSVYLWVGAPREMPFTAIECHLRGLNGWYLSEHKGLTVCSMNFVHVTSVIEIVERQGF